MIKTTNYAVDEMEVGTWGLYKGDGALICHAAGHAQAVEYSKRYRQKYDYHGTLIIRRPSRGH